MMFHLGRGIFLPTLEGLGFPFQRVAVVAVLCDQLPNLRDRQAEFAREIADLVFLVAAHAASIVIAKLVLVVRHDGSPKLRFDRNARQVNLFRWAFPGAELF